MVVLTILLPILVNFCRFAFRIVFSKLRPIRFSFDGYLGMHAEEGTNLRVGSFQATGTNFSSRFFDAIDGFVRSVDTGETYPMYINIDGDLFSPDETNGIPLHCAFGISVPFKKDGKDFSNPKISVPAEHFLRDIGSFEFVFHYNGKKAQYRFPRFKSQKMIERWREEINRPKSLSRVTRKIKGVGFE